MRSLLWTSAVVLLLAAPGSAQPPEPTDPDILALDSGPSVHLRGFADINFADTDNHRSDDGKSADGFSLGYLVGHLQASLGGKFSFHSEVTITSRDNQFTLDVARAFLRYDYNDHLKLSVGRYHAPVAYCNTAFHRGIWLQTTIFRPDMFKEEWFQPDHFLGAFAEGTLVSKAGIGYIAGYGNGRETDLGYGCAGDPTCTSHNRAQVVRIFARPPRLPGVEFGGAAYHDTIAIPNSGVFPELITSAYLAVTREDPEVIAEFSNVRHHDNGTGVDYNSQAFYVQVGYRPPELPKWKPYTRFEKAISADDEPVMGNLTNWKATVGLRY